jgi:glycosyltransferase involved in cell wall biosynthesis
VQYLDHPEYHSATKLAYLRAIVPRSARRAAVVTTPTEWVRTTVIERLGIEPDRVLVVRHGVDRLAVGALPDAAALRSRFGLGDGPFVVFPAITHPHKGHDFLLQTMARCWRDPDLRLVLLGGRGAADDAVERTIDACDLRSRVVRPGRVGERDRDGLLAAASALVFPSRYEGFGAPVIEAMALGTPVVCSDHPALTEVVGPAALVLPLEGDAWAGALDEVDRRRDELRAAGLDRVAGFTVAASGADLRAAYLRAIEVGR